MPYFDLPWWDGCFFQFRTPSGPCGRIPQCVELIILVNTYVPPGLASITVSCKKIVGQFIIFDLNVKNSGQMRLLWREIKGILESQIKGEGPNHLRTAGVQRNRGRLAIAANLGEVSILFWKNNEMTFFWFKANWAPVNWTPRQYGGKLGPLVRQIGPRQMRPLADWAHLDKVLEKLQCSFLFCMQFWQILTLFVYHCSMQHSCIHFGCRLQITEVRRTGYTLHSSQCTAPYSTYEQQLWKVCQLNLNIGIGHNILETVVAS